MTREDLITIERYRRWLRPDWRRFLAPDPERWLTPEQIKAQRHDFMLRDRAFETPMARRLRLEAEEHAQREQAEFERKVLAAKAELAALRVEFAQAQRAWEAECAERKRRSDLAWERFMAAFMRGDFRKANFNPSQPRVPAGNPDGGQWAGRDGLSSGTDAGDNGTGRSDPRILSDVTPDGFKPGAQLAQNETQRRYSVDLNEEDARGGHTLSCHVGKTDDELLAKVRGDRGSVGIARYARKREGSFASRESANDFVNRTLERNQALVDRVADGKSDEEFLKTRFGYRTGREAFRPSVDSEPYLRDTYEVGVQIRHDPRSARGYRVHTAYPMNEAPR